MALYERNPTCNTSISDGETSASKNGARLQILELTSLRPEERKRMTFSLVKLRLRYFLSMINKIGNRLHILTE